MKHIKKVINVFLILVLVLSGMFVPQEYVEAKTLGDLRRELQASIDQMEQNKQEQQKTDEELNATRNSINKTHDDINKTSEEIIKLGNEIVELNNKIDEKQKEIKDVINFLQVSSGESAYLEYTFGAKDFTDFIYRTSITEQLTKYNDKLIKEFNDMIEANKKKNIELETKKVELEKQKSNLEVQYASLGTRKNELLDIKVNIEDEIASQREAIKTYEDLGCTDNEDIKICGRSVLPKDTKFWRPVVSAYISSDFGDRCYWLNGKWTCDFHTGLDLAKGGANNPVYAAARGVVASTVRWTCGGNIIFINHNINGSIYTTVYMHLQQILVSPGDVVTKDTQIAIMGGGSTTPWDNCSTGQHTHFMVSSGMYQSWSTVISGLLNPRSIVNFPAGNSSFSDRITAY